MIRNHPDRLQAIQDARRLISNKPVFMDTETTGTGPSAEIIEISVIDSNGETLVDTLVCPHRPIPADATRIHGITNPMVQLAPSWAAVWPQVLEVLQGRPLGIYNAEFDLRLMRQTHRLYGMPWFTAGIQPFCIMKLYARFHGEYNFKTGDYRWISLDQAGQQCRLPLPNSHRARDDSLLARALLQFMADAGD